jgi:hypothetical protein
MQNITWVDELKVRGSWGQIGNQEIGMFQFVNAVDLGSNYAFGGSIAPGAAVNQSRDPDVSWETTTITNIGLDWSLFNNKLNGVAEVFRKRTDGILRTVAIPSQVGNLTGPTTNIATVDNIGFEIALSHKNKISKSFSYEIGGQITKVRNEVIDLNIHNSPKKHISWADENLNEKVNLNMTFNETENSSNESQTENIFKKIKLLPGMLENTNQDYQYQYQYQSIENYTSKINNMENEITKINAKLEEMNNILIEISKTFQKK